MKSRYSFIAIGILAAAAAGACVDGAEGAGAGGPVGQARAALRSELDKFIFDLGVLSPPPESTTQTPAPPYERVASDVVQFCNPTDVDETRHFRDVVTLDPNADALWPGSVVQTVTLGDGLLTPIGLARSGGAVTMTGAFIDGADPGGPVYSRHLPEVSHASVQEAIHSILSADGVNYAANATYNAYNVSSTEEGAIKLGLSGSYGKASLEASFGQDWAKSKTTFVVDFTQRYYTVSFATPASAGAVFADSVDLDDVVPYMAPGNPPGYVNSVTYGRRLILKVESDEESSAVEASLKATFGDPKKAGVSVDGDVESKRVLTESRVTILAVGGSSASVVSVLAPGDDKVAALSAYYQSGANFSAAAPGVPLSYTVRYLANNLPVVAAYATEFRVPGCADGVTAVDVRLDALDIHKNGESIGKGEINYDIFVDGQLVASGRDQKQKDGSTIEIAKTVRVSGPMKNAESFLVEARVSEKNKNVTLARTHNFYVNPYNVGDRGWTDLGDLNPQGSDRNLEVGLRYSASKAY